MPSYYRGAGVGTYWHSRDARLDGFRAWDPGKPATTNGLMHHVVRGTVVSPFISLSRSYGVAFAYATLLGRLRPTEQVPGFVYEIELDDAVRDVRLVDPMAEISRMLPDPLQSTTYHHDGLPDFLLGVIAPHRHQVELVRPYPQPPPAGGVVRAPKLSFELEALVRVLRDAEVLAIGAIPNAYVRHRYEVW